MQEILCYRIDDRLIHGQIAAVWTKHVKQTRIVVVDDEANRSDLQKQMLRLACPPGIKLSVLSIEKTINNFNQKKYDGDKIFMISKNPSTVSALLDRGFALPNEIVVGNMAGSPEKRQIRKGFNVTEEDISHFKKLWEAGITPYYQMLPTDLKEELQKIL